jgi:hypothetical protein
MAKIRIVHFGFVIPKNNCVQKRAMHMCLPVTFHLATLTNGESDAVIDHRYNALLTDFPDGRNKMHFAAGRNAGRNMRKQAQEQKCCQIPQ